MKQGEVNEDRAWFGFSLQELFWLLDRIPARDAFHDEIRQAIRKFDEDSGVD